MQSPTAMRPADIKIEMSLDFTGAGTIADTCDTSVIVLSIGVVISVMTRWDELSELWPNGRRRDLGRDLVEHHVESRAGFRGELPHRPVVA